MTVGGYEAQAVVSPKDIKSKGIDFLKKLKDRLTNRRIHKRIQLRIYS
jgi:hypothetical protein